MAFRAYNLLPVRVKFLWRNDLWSSINLMTASLYALRCFRGASSQV